MTKQVYTIEWHTSSSMIDNNIWEKFYPPPFEGKWWYEALEKSKLDDQFIFRFGEILLNNETMAIVPLFHWPCQFHRLFCHY